ncbi:MAG: cyclic nucleotide-binding domain-containing protein [Bryobacteraceae bacterium]
MLSTELKTHSFLAGMPDSHLAKLVSLARKVEFSENEQILRAGDRSRYFYLLLSGSVCVEVTARAYTVEIQALGPGEAFGWSSLLEHHDTLFHVRARERSTALSFESGALCAVLQQDTALAADLYRRTLRLVAGRVQASEARLGEMCGVRMPPGA